MNNEVVREGVVMGVETALNTLAKEIIPKLEGQEQLDAIIQFNRVMLERELLKLNQ